MDMLWKEVDDLASCFRQGAEAWLEIECGDGGTHTSRVRISSIDEERSAIVVELRRGTEFPPVLAADAWGVLASCGSAGVTTLEVAALAKNGLRLELDVRPPAILRQRRGALRLNVQIPLLVAFLPPADLGPLAAAHEGECERLARTPFGHSRAAHTIVVHGFGQHEHIDPVDINLSSEGFMVYTDRHVDPGTPVTMLLFIPGYVPQAVYAVGYVLRSVEACGTAASATDTRGACAPAVRAGQWMTAGTFLHLREQSRDAIARYLYGEQRRMLTERISR